MLARRKYSANKASGAAPHCTTFTTDIFGITTHLRYLRNAASAHLPYQNLRIRRGHLDADAYSTLRHTPWRAPEAAAPSSLPNSHSCMTGLVNATSMDGTGGRKRNSERRSGTRLLHCSLTIKLGSGNVRTSYLQDDYLHRGLRTHAAGRGRLTFSLNLYEYAQRQLALVSRAYQRRACSAGARSARRCWQADIAQDIICGMAGSRAASQDSW